MAKHFNRLRMVVPLKKTNMGYIRDIFTYVQIYIHIHIYWIHLHIVHGVSFLTILNEKWMSGPARTRASRQDLDKETSKCRQLEEVET